MTRKFNKCLAEGIVSYITLLMTENAESIYGVVTLMMTKHRIQLLSTTKEDLRPRLAHPQSKFAKLNFFSASDDFTSLTFSLLKITLLIIRFWATDWAQAANGIFQTSNNSTYISLPKTSTRRIIAVKLFYCVFLSRADASR